ncbi:hypothetical protein FOA52_008798, partial [Chlamydomonas sp. UWO 241]
YKDAGLVVVMGGLVPLEVAGLYAITVALNSVSYAPVAGGNATVLFVGGRRIFLSPMGVGSFQVAQPGLFAFELHIPLPSANVRITLSKPSYPLPRTIPLFYSVVGSSGAALLAGALPHDLDSTFGSGSIGTSTSSFQPPGVTLISGWLVHYNVTPGSEWGGNDATMLAPLRALVPGATFSSLTRVPDLAYSSSASLIAALPSDVLGLSGVLGVAFTRLRVSGGTDTSIVLRATCNRCIVWVDGLLVLNVWEGVTRGFVAKSSGCISVPAKVGAVVTVAFATPSLQVSVARLQLESAPCGTTRFGPLSSGVATSAAWQVSSNIVGYTNGMQCDVWNAATLPALNSETQAGSGMPQGAVSVSAPTFKTRRVGGYADFSIKSLFPGAGARPSPTFSVRCWTYLDSGAVATAGALALAALPASAAARLQLAGRQVWPHPGGSSGSPPSLTAIGTSWHMLVVAEWEGVTAFDALRVVTASGSPLGLSAATTKLPLLVLTSPSGSARPKGVGPSGHASVTRLPPPASDTPPQLLQYGQALLPVVGSFQSPANGLNGVFSYNSAIGGLVRYTRADGYLAAVLSGTTAYTLRLVDGIATSTSLTMAPGVSIISGRAFSGSFPSAESTATIVLPSGYVYTEAIAKTSRSDGKTVFYLEISDPVGASGAVDASVWFRPTSA